MNKFFIAFLFLIAVSIAATTTNPPNSKLWKNLDLKNAKVVASIRI